MVDLTRQTPQWLDEFASLAHSSTPGVEIVDNKESALDDNAPHGMNTDSEMSDGPHDL